ncbi:dTDP-4-amino-4,6-dideoxygalactose transaminase [Oceanotoga teriensis]|uniref:dTDP-4-amino-4,6-dideoxygalactose transaminase n=1 Tax=Oceanotoga teriensis TaxID=515440 RepID=A0AA45C877_9BACT|nr:DegT/DnrJ/EryC1/StrS family aminotransferase [Oceanotoga teriensis]PWJ95859.1 dTDP-4-amino-4,6-dideoxygalactose transaminase [Oceanotoga teriensis]
MKDKIIPLVKPSMPPYSEYINEIKDLWDTRYLTHTGPKHNRLEKALSNYLNVDKIALFTNGHLALELSILALEVKGEVITTPFTFISTTHAIVRNGLDPVFCDIKKDDYTIDASKIEELVTEKTSAILPVHVYGNICDYKEIERIAKKYNLKVIYDAAHAFGETVDGINVSNLGDASMFSFHATKVFHTVEGGGVTFKDDNLYNKFGSLRQFGMNQKHEIIDIGTNAKMTEIHAAMGLCNMKHIDDEIKKRKKVVERYRERLSDIKGIKLNEEKENIKNNYAYFPVLFDGYKANRDEVFEELKKSNIMARKYFFPLTNNIECYKDRFDVNKTPIAKYVADRILTLPLYADLELSDVDRICDIIINI